jgi:hypothetical protein
LDAGFLVSEEIKRGQANQRGIPDSASSKGGSEMQAETEKTRDPPGTRRCRES